MAEGRRVSGAERAVDGCEHVGILSAVEDEPLREIAGFPGQTRERSAALYSHHSPDRLARAREALE